MIDLKMSFSHDLRPNYVLKYFEGVCGVPKRHTNEWNTQDVLDSLHCINADPILDKSLKYPETRRKQMGGSVSMKKET